jgi:hypothetical protein
VLRQARQALVKDDLPKLARIQNTCEKYIACFVGFKI